MKREKVSRREFLERSAIASAAAALSTSPRRAEAAPGKIWTTATARARPASAA